MDKLVSIVSPCYNGESYLENYLDSVLTQTYLQIELILVDDASTDNTKIIVNNYIPKFKKKGYSLIYLHQEVNQGQAAAINRGLKVFTGDYFTWMDSDDIYYPNAIEHKVDYLENNPNIDIVLNEGEFVYSSNLNKTVRVLRREHLKQDDLFVDLIDERNVVFPPGSIMVRSSALKLAIPQLSIYESREGQNWQLMLPLAYCCKYGYLNEVLFKYLIHGDSHSHKTRTYVQEIQRRDNFFILQKETILRIEKMDQSEKKKWVQYSYIKQLKEKFVLSMNYGIKADYCKYRNELIRLGEQLPITKPYAIYQMFMTAKKIKRRLIKK